MGNTKNNFLFLHYKYLVESKSPNFDQILIFFYKLDFLLKTTFSG